MEVGYPFCIKVRERITKFREYKQIIHLRPKFRNTNRNNFNNSDINYFNEGSQCGLQQREKKMKRLCNFASINSLRVYIGYRIELELKPVGTRSSPLSGTQKMFIHWKKWIEPEETHWHFSGAGPKARGKGYLWSVTATLWWNIAVQEISGGKKHLDCSCFPFSKLLLLLKRRFEGESVNLFHRPSQVGATGSQIKPRNHWTFLALRTPAFNQKSEWGLHSYFH